MKFTRSADSSNPADRAVNARAASPLLSRWALNLYAALTCLAQPLLRRKLARRARLEPGYASHMEERFGSYRYYPAQPAHQTGAAPAAASDAADAWVWLHAVSLGETRTAALLLPLLRQRWPGMRLLLTHSTATGRAEGEKLLLPGDRQVWLPWDSRAAVGRFFDHFKPRIGLLMETEVWPLLLAAAQARGIPVLLVNARLSDKSLRQSLRLGLLARPAYAALTAVLAQSPSDASRFRQLGANVAGVLGNLKFDARPDAHQQTLGQAWQQALLAQGQRVVLLASSREGEEAEFFKAFKAFDQQTPAQAAINSGADQAVSGHFRQALAIRALVVPRHPQRFEAVAQLAKEHGLRLSKRSDWSQADGPAACSGALQADVWLGDSLGEMALYYSLASAALLGGSFAPLGGQNLIEAAACGCPVIMGPHTFNFAEAASLAEAEGAALRRPTLAAALEIAALGLAALPQGLAGAEAQSKSEAAQKPGGGTPARSLPMATECRLFAARYQGAGQRAVDAIAAYWPAA